MKKLPHHKGHFISLEGGEGAGKSTQARLLARYLQKEGYKVKLLREPGGTKISEAIRAVTHNPAHTRLSDRAEALLFAAARAQIVDEIYLPSLKRGYIVIADRYVDSSYVYQGIARDLGYISIKVINDFATNRLLPDLTILLDTSYRLGHERRQKTAKIDRMDLQKRSFYREVEKGYRVLAEKFSDRITVIDGNQPIQRVHRQVVDRIKRILD